MQLRDRAQKYLNQKDARSQVVHRLNAVKMHFRIQLSLATALLSFAYLCGGEAALRLLRII